MNSSTYCIFALFLSLTFSVNASGTLTESELSAIDRTTISTEEQRALISKTAGLLSLYEISAQKLIDSLADGPTPVKGVENNANELLLLSEQVFYSASFRLPQCQLYLEKTLPLKNALTTISHDKLESDYHLDGALPVAPSECYHTKDLFVHPATVLVITRDDPELSENSVANINNEIQEVLAHTELVRKLIIY